MSKSGHVSRAVALVWTCATLLASAAESNAQHAGPTDPLVDQQALESTNQMLQALRLYERTPAAQRDALSARLNLLATQRRDRMLALIEADPTLAALRTLPQAIRARLPADAQALVEEPVMIRGSISATVGDDFARGRSRTQLHLTDTAGQRFELSTAQASGREQLRWVGKRGAIPALRFGRHLLVIDKRNVQLLASDGTPSSSGSGTGASSSTAPASAVQGSQSTLVVMLNFTDVPISCTATDLQSRLFGTGAATLDQGYRQSSGNLVSFTGNVIGPFNTSFASTGSCDPNGWAAAANAAALAAGFNPGNYKRVSYATPPNASCGWSGLGTLGGTSPTPSWVQSCAATGVFSHELGHNLLLHHASTPTSEYGDSSDPMGAALLVQFNAANRVMAGWVSGSQLQDVSVGGSYAIDALENVASTNPLVLRMPKSDTADTYYVSLRQGTNLDAALPSGYKGALSIHYATGTMPAQTFRVANLSAGQSWTDSVNGITITHQGLTATGASIGVMLGGGTCTRASPTVSVTPASQSAAPGATLNYTLTLQNNNSSACPPATFNLAQSLPSGFTGSLSSTSTALGAGAVANVGWAITSSSATTDAAYTLSASATESTVSNSAVALASYTVLAPVTPPPAPAPIPTADTTPPSLTINSPAPGVTVSGRNISVSATATDASGVATVEFYIDGKLLASDTSAPYTANWNLRKASAGSHLLRIRATDTKGNSAEQSFTVTVK
jgi:hypothetical protein